MKMYKNYILVFIALFACTVLGVTNTTMPSYYAVGKTPMELGESIGIQQRDAFQQLLKADNSLKTVLIPWMERHPDQYKAFCDANKKAYPDIYEEIQGIAKGAGIEESSAILLMLRPEVESLVADEFGYTIASDHCFDIMNNPKDENGIAFIAHNEDWTPAYKPFGFVLHENMPFSKNGATHITAFTYPASPVGFTFGYNDYGVVTSCNGLNPHPCRPGKLGRYFINRDVLAATSVDDAINRLKNAAKDSALGFAMSIGRVGSHVMYHAEMAPYVPGSTEEGGHVDIIEIKPGESFLHSNAYEHEFFKNINQTISNSTQHRLARARQMTAPTTPELAISILGDETTPVYPIYRYGIPPDELATISTAVLNLDNATVTIWGGNPTRFDPVVVMPLYYSPVTDFDYAVAFFVCVGVAGLILLAFIITVIVLAVRKNNDGSSVNSSYERVR